MFFPNSFMFTLRFQKTYKSYFYIIISWWRKRSTLWKKRNITEKNLIQSRKNDRRLRMIFIEISQRFYAIIEGFSLWFVCRTERFFSRFALLSAMIFSIQFSANTVLSLILKCLLIFTVQNHQFLCLTLLVVFSRSFQYSASALLCIMTLNL